MNCQNCGFYCYDDEYICPSCEVLLEKKLHIDGFERSLFIHNNIVEFKKRKRVVKIVKTRKILLVIIIIIQVIWSFWLSTFIVYRFPVRTNYVMARYSIVFALSFYIIFLGNPEIPSNKPYVKVRKPKGLINKGNIKKSTYLIIILLIFIITCVFYLFYFKNLFLSDIIKRSSPRLETFGVGKLGTIIDIRYFIHAFGIGIFYAIHPIYNITDADYFILTRRDLHKKNL